MQYLYPGARTAVILHEESMRQFYGTWKTAKHAIVHPMRHRLQLLELINKLNDPS